MYTSNYISVVVCLIIFLYLPLFEPLSLSLNPVNKESDSESIASGGHSYYRSGHSFNNEFVSGEVILTGIQVPGGGGKKRGNCRYLTLHCQHHNDSSVEDGQR